LDSKTALQELSALMNLASPEYEITESGPDHDKSFMACVLLGDEKFPVGKGKSKREAEQAAAKSAYEVLVDRNNK
jgi:ribonuclease-3